MNDTLCHKSKYQMKMQLEIKAVFEEWQAFLKRILACVHGRELVCASQPCAKASLELGY